MAYIKNTWVDQDVERPKTYEVTNNQDGSITLTDSFGLVTELGTPVNALNMNHIEDGIDGCAIRKHNLTETFNLGEWVLGGTGDDEGIYKSLEDNNVGNAITDDTKWEKVEMGGGATRNIGEIVASTIPLADAGLHLLDGSLLSYGSYQAFIDYIADLYDSGDYTDIFETEANWQTSVTTYGVCGKFVYDSVNNTVRLPKITGFIEGTTDTTALLDLVEAGLPNITGETGGYVYTGSNGALSAVTRSDTAGRVNGGSGQWGTIVTLDASNSNSIYGNSSTVQPQAIKVLYYIVVATTTKTEIEVDIDEIATDLNGKADVDLTNVSHTSGFRKLVDSYINGTSWYKVFSEYDATTGDYIGQWCEQGGVVPVSAAGVKNVVFLKTFKDANYTISCAWCRTQGAVGTGDIGVIGTGTILATGFSIYQYADQMAYWRACGYIS